MTAMILGVVAVGLACIRRLDPHTFIPVTVRCRVAVLAGGMAGGLSLWCMEGEGGLLTRLLLAVIWGSLLLACITDVAICQVYNFVWWISGTAAMVLLWLRFGIRYAGCAADMAGHALHGNTVSCYPVEGSVAVGSIIALVVFCALQLLLFSRLYGLADCYAFCVCAVVECGYGAGMGDFLMHCFLAVGLLLPVQAVKRNLNKYGNLKKPVPFLPYITVSFYLVFFIVKL